MKNLKSMTDWGALEKYLNEEAEQADERKIDEAAFLAHLKSRVKGQDEIIAAIAKSFKLQFACRRRSQPISNLLFLGPTGTGKTELAKAIAEYLFKDENAMVRFDCSELTGEHSKDRLVGMPTGYVGSEQGGQLTRPVIENPRRVILFDEIEKAYSGVFDLFLQLMGEGRLTEQGSGKTVDYTQCVIILTSNSQWERLAKIKAENSDYHEMLNAMKSHLADTHAFRPEILGRIDRLFIFDSLKGPVVAEIALLKIAKIAMNYGVEVEFVAPEYLIKALEANKKVSRFGIRELERILFDEFAPHFVKAREMGLKKVRLGVEKTGQLRIAA